MATRRFTPSTEMAGVKIDPLTEIRNLGIITNGDVYWVSNESDGQHRKRINDLGRGVVKTSIQAGIDATLTDNNDYVLVVPQDANAVWTIGTALDLNKDRVKLLSVGYSKAQHGYTNTIQGFATTAAGTPVDTSMLDVTGAGCEVAGFHILGTAGTSNGGTVNQIVNVGTDDLWMHDCNIEGNDSAADTSLLAGVGSVNGFRADDVVFQQTGTADSPATPINIPNGAKRWEFNDCDFHIHASATSDEFVNAGTGSIFYTKFTRCRFLNTNAGTAPASVVVGSVTVDDGVVLMDYCSSVNCTQMGTDPSVFVSPAASGTLNAVYNPGISVGTAAVTAA